MTPFQKLKKGQRPTFLEAEFANQVLGFLNGLINAKVAPGGAGKFVWGPDTMVLDLTPMQAATQAAQIDALAKQYAALQGQMNAVIASLKGAKITAVCDSLTGQITVTITFSKLP